MWKALAVVATLGGVAYADEPVDEGKPALPDDEPALPENEPAVTVPKPIEPPADEPPSQARPLPPRIDHRRPSAPPLTGGRFAAQLLVGGVAGAGGAAIGGLIGAGLNGSCYEYDCLVRPVIGGGIGYTLGISVGVYVIGTTDEVDASFGLTLAGSALGMASGIALAANALRGVSNENAAIIVVLGAPIAGAMMGFQLTRKWRDVHITPVATHNTVGFAGTF